MALSTFSFALPWQFSPFALMMVVRRKTGLGAVAATPTVKPAVVLSQVGVLFLLAIGEIAPRPKIVGIVGTMVRVVDVRALVIFQC